MSSETRTRGFLLGLAMLGLLLSGCAGADCKEHVCTEFANSDVMANGKHFTKCYAGGGPITTTLLDEAGKQFFECTDGASSTCTESTVNAEFSYCEVAPR